MRSVKHIYCSLVLMLFFVLGVTAQDYAAKVTLKSGNSFVVKKLNVSGDRLYRDGEASSSVSVSMIEKVEFRFAGVALPMCESMFRSGDRKSLESVLNQYVVPVVQYNKYFQTNLGDYLVWMLRSQYWNRNESGTVKTIGELRKLNDPVYADIASLYFVMILLDQGKLSNAKTVFASVSTPENISVPMAEFIRGKLALDEGDARQAMQHVARIVAFHGRDPEWMAPATVLEARIYQYLNQPYKADAVARELMIAYPGTQWSKLGEQIKQEATGKSGG